MVAAVAVVLLAQRRWQVAVTWLLAISGVLGTLLLLKTVGYACGWLLPALGPGRLDLHSPSGHVASGAVVCSGIVMLQGRRPWHDAALAALAVALAAAVIIGATRVLLGAHSLAEVVVATGIGGIGAAAFGWAGGRRLVGKSGLPAAAAAAMVLVAFHGRHLPAEAVIQSAAADLLRHWITACRPN